MNYKDCSTVIITPSKGLVNIKAVESWMNLRLPLNNRFFRIFTNNLEVGVAYDSTIDFILDHPELSKYKFVLTIEDDNLPPTDGLLKLFENTDKYDVIGGLYYSKGENRVPMIFGDVNEDLNFIPQEPIENGLQPCYAVGMGFTLYKMEVFRNQNIKRPFFKTVNTDEEIMTQDIYFFKKIAGLYKVACDTRVKVGHIDSEGKVW